jgi:hypothetical protein
MQKKKKQVDASPPQLTDHLNEIPNKKQIQET